MLSTVAFLLTSLTLSTTAIVLPRDDVRLAVNPACGDYSSSSVKDVRGSLPDLKTFSTIVTFGDSYTDGGKHDGSPLGPAAINAPIPSAGGRHTNGPVWAEYLAKAHGATLKDYASTGAVVDVNQWPERSFPTSNDFLTQANNFISQRNLTDPDSTLYVVFFGIGDYVESLDHNNSSLSLQTQHILYTINRLASSPIFGKNFLFIDNHGRGTETPAGSSFKSQIFKGMNSIQQLGLNTGFVDLSTMWDGVLSASSPGFEAFGYTSVEPCLDSSESTEGSCEDPEHAFYWFPGAPTTVTHKLISDYVQAVWDQC
ncbi:hypothetical protein AGABI2DRAFT_192139 [Agaricus bisporus var. bisporus H97]|uniref:hypothetical protein n=1 Tax=Agaricus bisporus var. bisporus (strain H97 / ATCC MYA-4626 / FGSC 10389) TaxID=936046 RepID=UPI00029F568D|nr:hypothetical protein AGABI2DRAFT_192139 [Agaricus bisporus var. bisporus H97]EKV48566.1 hypothetical protein AGABI2DRAFT_192139 [Agaricus bisporus var. bisporus H97]